MNLLIQAAGYPINENQFAIEAAIIELSNRVEARGAADVANNVHRTPDTLDKNKEFIKMTLAVLMAPECFQRLEEGVTMGEIDWKFQGSRLGNEHFQSTQKPR